MSKFLFYFFFFSILFLTNSFSDIIEKVDINGNKRISDQTIIVLGNIKIGSNYDNDQLNDIIKNLYDTNFFDDIALSLNNKILSIDLVENPIIENIQITGIKSNSVRDNLLKTISLNNRKPFNEYQLSQDLNLIKNILKTNGFYFVKINSSILKNDDLNTINLTLNIEEGPKAKIKKISFIGDKKIKDKKLIEIIASEEHKFWKFISTNVYLNESRIDLDKRLITNYYKNLGFYNVEVKNVFAELDKLGDFNLVYNINAGDIFYFNDLKINLPEDYDISDFNKIYESFKLLKGEKYSFDELNKLLNDIEKIASLRLYDFIDAKIEENIVEDNKINFTFNISDSEKFYVERINILGNFNTIEEVVRNKLVVDEGDPLNILLYNKSIDQIRSLGIFKDVNGTIKDGSEIGFKIIDINLEEQPTGEISLAAGIGTSGSVIGGGITEKNFLGKGINLKSFLEISEDSVKGEFIYSKPNFAYTDNTLFTSLNSTSDDRMTNSGYKLSEIGFSIGTEFEQYENIFLNPSLKLSLENLETDSTAKESIKKQEGNYNDLYFNYGITYDQRNSKFRPKNGNLTNFYQALPIHSDGNELENTFIFTQYKELSSVSEMIGRASVYLKTVNTIDDSNVRISKRANIPYNRLRGFERNRIGPIDNNDYVGGNYVSSLNFSVNIPQMLSSVENIDFLYFLDLANVWGVDYDDSINDSNALRSSTGIGMNLLTPVGPLSFSLSQPITKKSTDKTETFRFNLGTSF
jgi:outer membrane protein insertion porin family